MRGMFRVAIAEYKRWLYNPRILLLFILIIYARETVGKILCEHAVAMQTELHCLEPYIALNNSQIAILIMPIFFLVLMSDFPVMEGSYLWAIYRAGKIKWIFTQMLYSLFAILTVMGGMFLSAILSCWGSITIQGGWSDVTTRYHLAFPNEINAMVTQLIRGDVYNQLSIGHAFALSVGLTVLMLLLYCAIMLCGKIYGKKYLPLCVCIGLIGLGATLQWVQTRWVFLFPAGHALLSGHRQEYVREPIMPYWMSYLYFIIALMVVLIIAIIGIKRRDVCKKL